MTNNIQSFAGIVGINGTTDSTSTSTGALQVAGGAGIASNLYVGGALSTTSATINDYINHDGDTGTRFGFSADDTFIVDTAGTSRLTIDSDGATTLSGALSATSGTFSGQVTLDTATLSGALSATSGTFSGQVTLGTASSIRQTSTPTSTGDPGFGVGKIEYNSNRWYIVAGSNSDELLRIRQDDTDKFVIDNAGKITSGIVPAVRITGTVANATTATNVNLAADNASSATRFITFANSQSGGQGLKTDSGLTYNPSTNTISAVTLNANVVADNVVSTSLLGNIVGSNTISASTITVDDVTVTGNLTVMGTTTTIDTDNLFVKDPIVVLSNAAAAVDSGIMINRPAGGLGNVFSGFVRTGTTASSPTVIQLSQEVVVTGIGGVYQFNGAYDASKTFGMDIGTYTFTDIPEAHAIRFTFDPSSAGAMTSFDVNKKKVGVTTGEDYYWGTVEVTVTDPFTTGSYACWQHGAMGGTNNLTYSPFVTATEETNYEYAVGFTDDGGYDSVVTLEADRGFVANVYGNVEAQYFKGNGSQLTGLITDAPTLQSVTDTSNITSNTVLFTNTDTSLVASGDIVSRNIQLSNPGITTSFAGGTLTLDAANKTYGTGSMVTLTDNMTDVSLSNFNEGSQVIVPVTASGASRTISNTMAGVDFHVYPDIATISAGNQGLITITKLNSNVYLNALPFQDLSAGASGGGGGGGYVSGDLTVTGGLTITDLDVAASITGNVLTIDGGNKTFGVSPMLEVSSNIEHLVVSNLIHGAEVKLPMNAFTVFEVSRSISNVAGYSYSNVTVIQPGELALMAFSNLHGSIYADLKISYPMFVGFSATGGTVDDTIPGYRIHTFTTSDDFEVTSGGEVEYLVVAGGGGGGCNHGGGGGAGGYLEGVKSVSSGTHPVIIGGGGAGADNTDNAGVNGTNSSAILIESTGGGGGGGRISTGETNPGQNGGSGGGGAGTNPTTAGSAVPSGQGNNGGIGSSDSVAGNGGGGGGAGEVGEAGTGASGTGKPGDGGDGKYSNITGINTPRGGGGGGGRWAAGTGSSGGVGGGAAGGGEGVVGGSATVNTGGGGGGGGGSVANGGAGADGIVIIRYAV